MPRLSDTMEEGTIGRWLKQPGDKVEKGDILAEIETDKATMELEAYESGTLQKIMVGAGETVPIGATIGMIGEGPAEANGGGAAPTESTAKPAAGEAPPADKGSPGEAKQRKPAEAPQATERQPAEVPGTAGGNGHIHEGGERVKASPVARRLADEYGIDLRQVQGTGPGGRIIKENVESFQSQGGAAAAPQPAAAAQPAPAQQPAPQPAAAPQPAPAPAAAPAPPPPPALGGTVQPMNRMRKAIARNMNQAKPGMPHIYVTAEADMEAAIDLRKQINESGAAPVKISVNDMVMKAVAKALVKFPILNASYTQDEKGQPAILYQPQVNVCVAVALEDGLVAPVVKDTDKKSVGAISAEIKDMASRAREGKIKQEELDGGTFTVSNLGMYDVVEFGAIITSPQAGILAVGAVREIPVVKDGAITIGQRMYITVSADHRLADGAIAAQFVREVKGLLEAPMGLLV
jgi:pyruvate dehydrogenase E2 component (dihydrolipoamide acetyltransferase)